MQFLSPRSDIGFKKVFGQQDHVDITMSFLNSILDRKEGQLIKEITFIGSEQTPDKLNPRKSILDIHCIDQKGNAFIIEMQNKYQAFFMERCIYYISLVFSRQSPVPFKYNKLMPVILIAVLDHNFSDHNDVISRHALMDIEHHTISSNHVSIYFIQLPNFKKELKDLKTDADRWIYFMKKADRLQAIPETMQESKEFISAFRILERMKWTEEEFVEYIRELDDEGYDERVLAGAKELGKAEGKAEGAEKKAEAVAIKLLKKDVDFLEISELTDLSIEHIERLRKTLLQ